MYISYDYYRIFYYAAKYRSITRAAQVLMNNQPNITRTIKNLENALGTELFVRSNRGVTLTAEGERLYRRVAAAVEQISIAEEEFEQAAEQKRTTVSIGASETALHLLLLEKLKIFHKNRPEVRIKIFNHTTPQALTALLNSEVDFAVVASPTDVSKPLKETAVAEICDIMVCGEGYRSLSEGVHCLAELQAYPLVCLSKESRTYEFLDALYRTHGLSLQADIEASTTDQVLPIIKNDLAIGFLPEKLAAHALEDGEIFRIQLAEEIPKRKISIVTNTDSAPGSAARELISELCS